MKVEDVINVLNAKIICGEENLGQEVQAAFASDLMSDVLTLENGNILLITGLANTQAIRTAEMSDIKHIVIVRNKKATGEMIELARENGMTLLECHGTMFKASGLLFCAGLKPVY
ncbi:MAG: hypothetical protein ACOC2F_02945 [Bacteroidota bacterium]